VKISRHVALVTGGASGPGLATVLATVRELRANGAHVVILDLPSSRGKEIAGELGDRAVFSPGDVTVPASVTAWAWVSAPAG
jgi:NAD(P)-dependent dehydrogenase (short-subunit alcohol dehydrogenase family)